MNRNIIAVVFIVIAVALIVERKENPHVNKPSANPLIVEFNEVHDFANLRPGHIERATTYVLKSADLILSDILSVPDADRTFDNTLVAIDDIYMIIESVWSPGYLMGSTHTNKDIRDEGLASSQTIQKYLTDLSLNEDLYNAVVTFSKSKEAQQLTRYKKKFLEDTLLDYQRSGFGLPKEKRVQVKEIFEITA